MCIRDSVEEFRGRGDKRSGTRTQGRVILEDAGGACLLYTSSASSVSVPVLGTIAYTSVHPKTSATRRRLPKVIRSSLSASSNCWMSDLVRASFLEHPSCSNPMIHESREAIHAQAEILDARSQTPLESGPVDVILDP